MITLKVLFFGSRIWGLKPDPDPEKFESQAGQTSLGVCVYERYSKMICCVISNYGSTGTDGDCVYQVWYFMLNLRSRFKNFLMKHRNSRLIVIFSLYSKYFAKFCGFVDFLYTKQYYIYVSKDNYSVFFFIELKVFVNLTYLYLSEIKKQGLIFSIRLGHLIINFKFNS